MSRPQRPARPPAPRRPRPGGTSWLKHAHHLTARDEVLLLLLHHHTTLTTRQVQELWRASPDATRRRLGILRRQGWIDSSAFDRSGRYRPLHWVLADWGSRCAAAYLEEEAPTARHLSLHNEGTLGSSQLAHTDGIHGFFLALIAGARALDTPTKAGGPGGRGGPDGAAQASGVLPRGAAHFRLARWWSSARTARFVEMRVRPDAHGVWEHRAAGPTGPSGPGGTGGERLPRLHQVGFYLEYDRGTETLERLAAKLGPYERLWNEGFGPGWALLIVVPGSAREDNLHRLLSMPKRPSHQGHPSHQGYQGYQGYQGPAPGPAAGAARDAHAALPVFTTNEHRLSADRFGPAGPVWRAVRPPGARPSPVGRPDPRGEPEGEDGRARPPVSRERPGPATEAGEGLNGQHRPGPQALRAPWRRLWLSQLPPIQGRDRLLDPGPPVPQDDPLRPMRTWQSGP